MARLQFGATDQVVPSSHFINRHVITIRHYHKGLPSGVMHIDTLKNLAIDALEELKARDITQLDVAKLTEVTDLMLIASGTTGYWSIWVTSLSTSCCPKRVRFTISSGYGQTCPAMLAR